MDAIERDNDSLKGVLPKNFGSDNLDKQVLGQVVDLVSNIKVDGAEAKATDVLGQVYEYFLEQCKRRSFCPGRPMVTCGLPIT